MYMALCTLYLHMDFSKDAHHSKVFELATLKPYSYTGDPKAAHGPLAYEYGLQDANLKTWLWWNGQAGLLKEQQ